MIESLLYETIYKLDFIDLNILEQIISNDYIISFLDITKRMKKVNVWNRGIIRRRVKRLKELKLIHYEENTNPLIIESYLHKEQELKILKELLKKRLIRY